MNQGNNISIHVEADSEAEARRMFDGLAEGGKVDMPMAPAEWAELFGGVTDRFGVPWMISYTGNVTFTYPD